MGGGKFFTERRYKASLRSDHPQGRARRAHLLALTLARKRTRAGRTAKLEEHAQRALPSPCLETLGVDPTRTEHISKIEKRAARREVRHVRLRLDVLVVYPAPESGIKHVKGIHQEGGIRAAGVSVNETRNRTRVVDPVNDLPTAKKIGE